MNIKFEKKVELSQEQMLELAKLLEEPDMGWGKDAQGEPIELKHSQYYDEVSSGDYGEYHYRVNLSYQLITVKEVK